MIGQINLDSEFGKHLYSLAKQPDIKTIVEIGTWNGCGSTKCIASGIIDSNDTKNFISLETNNDMFLQAQQNLTDTEKTAIKLIRGRITEFYDLVWLKDFTLGPEQQRWLWEDIAWYKDCPFVLDQIPEQIDLLLLDGGEFTTVPEFKALKNRYKIIALDDTRALKTKSIHEYLLQKTDHVLIASGDERNGFSIFKKRD
jgi:hypothetical protein